MKIAYIISAYRYPEQLSRLVTRLMTDFVEFYIHVDLKTPARIFDAMQASLSGYENVHFLDRHKCHYCGFGHVQASLKGIARVTTAATSFDYSVLLTGQDYPLKSNEYIRRFFVENSGKSFMQYFRLSDPRVSEEWPDALERFKHWRIQGRRRAYVLPPSAAQWRPFFSPVSGPIGLALKHCLPLRKPIEAFDPYGGSSYWNLNRECLTYIEQFVRLNRRFVRFFKYMGVPDEHFFQTILLNSPLRASIVNDSLRFIDWHGHTGSSPRTLLTKDFDKLAASENLFARKFDATVDSRILDKIDSTLLASS